VDLGFGSQWGRVPLPNAHDDPTGQFRIATVSVKSRHNPRIAGVAKSLNAKQFQVLTCLMYLSNSTDPVSIQSLTPSHIRLVFLKRQSATLVKRES
jgi:hypothetical protein